MAEKINQRTMLTKRLLKDSLVDMLGEMSIHKISIRDLCERAGLNRSTFYRYYGSQFDLLREMEDDMIQSLVDILQGESCGVQCLCRVCQYLEEHLEMARLMINNNVDPTFPERLFSLPMVQQSVYRSQDPALSDAEREYVSCLIINGSFAVIRQWLNKDTREPPELIASLIPRVILIPTT
ncbi:MAG: TetR/AcrR family transcriptional regulator [Oscillospiraceae bacterium]|nr:TetR/AcrR family transcriptional regulator [Oscillospiraceae bacterium]